MPLAAIRQKRRQPNPFLNLGKDIANEQATPFNGVLTILDYLSRPANTIAGAATAISKGRVEDTFSFAFDGFTGKKRFQFDKVLKNLGVGEGGTGVKLPFFGEITARGTAGLALDILTDPLTYIGIGTVTKAGRGIRRGLTKNAAEGVGAVKSKFSEITSNAITDLRKRKRAEVATSFRNFEKRIAESGEFDKATGKFSDARLDKVFDVAEKKDGTFTFQMKDFVERRVQGKASVTIEDKFTKGMLPALQERFKKEIALQGDDILFQGKSIFNNPGVAKELEELVGLSDMLDEVVKVNQGNVQMIRNIEDAASNLRGSTMAAQARKGFRSALTFGGHPVIPGVGKAFGLSPEKLRKMDESFFAVIDQAFDKISTWPMVKQIKDSFTVKSGIPLADELLSKFRGEEQALARIVLQQQLEIAQKSLIAQQKNPSDIKRIFEETLDALESTGHHLAEPELALTPEVDELVTSIRKALDFEFAGRKASSENLGSLIGEKLDISYLKGYFPRQLTPEVKELMEGVMEGSPIKHGIFLTHEKGRRFKDLTTNEINQLFRENHLGIRAIEHAFKNNKKFRNSLSQLDGETASFFIEDPALATMNRIAAGARVSSKRNQTASLLRIFARPVHESSKALEAGETLITPTGLFNLFDQNEFKNPARMRKVIKDTLGYPKNMPNDVVEAMYTTFQQVKTKDVLNTSRKAGRSELAATKMWTEINFSQPHMFATMQDLGVPVYAADKRVVKLLNDFWHTSRDPVKYNLMLKGYDALTTLWKRFTLGIFPEFHSRNFLSDMVWLNTIGGINLFREASLTNGAYTKALQVIKNSELSDIFTGPRKLLKAENKTPGYGITMKTNSGTTLHMDDEWREFVAQGGLGGFFKAVEFEGTTAIPSITSTVKDFVTTGKKRTAKALNPLKPTFLPVQAGQQLGDGMQAWARFGHYLAKRKGGLMADEAMFSVKKHLFDYSELTNFERHVMRRVFPFYTWLRKNIPVQLETLIKRPGYMANLQKALNSLGDEEVREKIPEGGVPKFIRDEWGVPTREVSPGVFEFQLMGSFIPAADLVKLGSPREVLRLGAKSFNPLPQTVVENFVNQNFFSGLPVENYPGEVGTFLGNVVPKSQINALRKIRLLNTADTLFFKEDPNNPFRKKQFTTREKLLKLGTGLRPTQIDTEKVKQQAIFRSNLFASKLNQSLKRAKKLDDPAMLEYLQDLLAESQALGKQK